jgi:16S rRNA (guanine527-N7)-methyltransferase
VTDEVGAGFAKPLIELTSEQQVRLDIYKSLLLRWQRKINLISNTTTAKIWERHFLDSLQLLAWSGAWLNWVDLGSGGGFPGMVVAIMAPDPRCTVHLIEVDKRKSAFLAEVSRETGAPVEIHVDRIERALPPLAKMVKFDAVSARALAPLSELVELSWPVLQKGACGLFLKGREAVFELTNLAAGSNLSIKLVPSATDPGAKIVVLRALKT